LLFGDGFNVTVEWVKEQMQEAWDMVNDPDDGLLAVPGLGPMKCLSEEVLQPLYEKSEDTIAGAIQIIAEPILNFLPTMMDSLETFLGETAEAAADSDDWFGEVTTMLRTAVQKTCVDDLASGNLSSEAISLVPLVLNIVEPMMTSMQAWIMDAVVEPVARGLQSLAEQLSDTIMHAIDGAAGLAPFIGAFISALLASATSSVRSMLQEVNHDAIVFAASTLLGEVTTWLTDTITSLGEEIESLVDFVMDGPFGPVASIVTQFIEFAITAVGGDDVQTCVAAKEALLAD